MMWSESYNTYKIKRNRKNYRGIDPLALERRNKGIDIQRQRREKESAINYIAEMEYGKFH